MDSPERLLAAALDALDRPVTFWWRDDDAGRDDPRLRRLLALARARDLPLALAAVPAWLEQAAADAISAAPQTTVLQHGIAHADHARPGEKKVELGGLARIDALEPGLTAGRERLRDRFGGRFLPVLVPPWNRIADVLVPRLLRLGFAGLSRFGEPHPPPGLCEVNARVDLVLWHEGRRPMTLEEIVAALAQSLDPPPSSPLGILSHHLVMEEDAFLALDRALAVLQDHPTARLADARALFGEAG
jgi:hypothetical protein